MEAAELIRKLIDVLSQINQPAQTDAPQAAKLTPVAQPQHPYPEDEHTSDETGGVMVPPLQQKMELLKKVAGVDSVYDKPGEEPNDEVSIMKRNAGIPASVVMSVEDDDVME